MKKSATMSPCRKYRYTLERIWDESKPVAMFIGLNPSTADEKEDDPTLRRCVAYARSWGYGGLTMTNLFAFRTRFPGIMLSQSDPIGKDNDHHLVKVFRDTGITVAAWGANGSHLRRSADVVRMLGPEYLCCIRKTKAGAPAHPLYLPKKLKPISLNTGEPVSVPIDATMAEQLSLF